MVLNTLYIQIVTTRSHTCTCNCELIVTHPPLVRCQPLHKPMFTLLSIGQLGTKFNKTWIESRKCTGNYRLQNVRHIVQASLSFSCTLKPGSLYPIYSYKADTPRHSCQHISTDSLHFYGINIYAEWYKQWWSLPGNDDVNKTTQHDLSDLCSSLTYCGRDKMVAILQTTFSNIFYMEVALYCFKCQWPSHESS